MRPNGAGGSLTKLTSIEMCAGAGGQALGLAQAGFTHLACVEIDPDACRTLRANRPDWCVIEGDITSSAILERAAATREAGGWRGVDLLAGGVPCPPFSVAGKQLGHQDERDLFPAMIELAAAARPRAVLIENVRGLLDPRFELYRERIADAFEDLGYEHVGWRLFNASDFEVPQLRPRVAMVALLPEAATHFSWPEPSANPAPTVGDALEQEMGSRGWAGAKAWAARAVGIAPTLVGGSKKHGGPDLGPTRAKRAWAQLGVNAHTIAEEAPGPDHDGLPRLTVRMAARLQGFPPEWAIKGHKTTAYRQVGNAFPPPVARALGEAIAASLATADAEEAALRSLDGLTAGTSSEIAEELVRLRVDVWRQRRLAESRARIEHRTRSSRERMRHEIAKLRAAAEAKEAARRQAPLPWDDVNPDRMRRDGVTSAA